MLIIGRHIGRQILIGDHSIVTVSSLMPDGQGVNLGFETRDQVRRVDSPELAIEAAKVKARIINAYKRKPDELEKVPVYVGYRTFESGEVDLRASLRLEMVDVAGYRIVEVGEDSALAPANHQFVVIRSFDESEIETIKKLINARLINWRFYESVERDDATFYALFVHATKSKSGGDVRYVDFSEF